MRRNCLVSSASLVALLFGLLIAFTTGASAASKEKVIYSFQGGSDGAQPQSDLVADAAGNLFGTTTHGGTGCSGGCGTVFELARAGGGWKEVVLYSFSGRSDGGWPQTGMIFDKAGNLYGTTVSTVFELSPNGHGGWTLNTLYSFTGDAGYGPAGDLVFDDKGNLYGANSGGGSGGTSCDTNGCGTVFELSPQTGGLWTETTLHVFQPRSSDGVVPSSGVALDAAGNVYGMTQYGGAGSCQLDFSIQGCGTIYELTPGSGGTWTETILYSFARGCGLAVYPSGGMVFDKAAHTLGTSRAGGNGFGTVFELRDTQKNGWQQGILHRFFGLPDGSPPVGRLVGDATGDLFGAAAYGGANRYGTVFQIRHTKDGWKERILHSFGGAGDGANPGAGPVFDREGHLYGTTEYGGSGTACNSGCGTVYEVTP